MPRTKMTMFDVVENAMRDNPIGANHQKTDDKALKLVPEVKKLCYQLRLPEGCGNVRHFYVEHEQGDGDGEDSIVEDRDYVLSANAYEKLKRTCSHDWEAFTYVQERVRDVRVSELSGAGVEQDA